VRARRTHARVLTAHAGAWCMAPRAAVNSSTIYSALRMVRRWAGSSARPAAGAVPDVASGAAPPNGARHSRPVGGCVWPVGNYRRWLPWPRRWYAERRCRGISSEGGLSGHMPATLPSGAPPLWYLHSAHAAATVPLPTTAGA
jgi:hypothetical protein